MASWMHSLASSLVTLTLMVLNLSCLHPRSLVPQRGRLRQLCERLNVNHPDPGTGPPTRLFVPEEVRSQVLQWGHSSKLSCHPGVQPTLLFLWSHFWWPGQARDVSEFVVACVVCARSKALHRPPAPLTSPCSQPPFASVVSDFILLLSLVPSCSMTDPTQALRVSAPLSALHPTHSLLN